MLVWSSEYLRKFAEPDKWERITILTACRSRQTPITYPPATVRASSCALQEDTRRSRRLYHARRFG